MGVDEKTTSSVTYNGHEVEPTSGHHEPFAHSMAMSVPTMGGEFTDVHPKDKGPLDDTVSIHSLKTDEQGHTEEITDTFVPFPKLEGLA